MSFKQRWAQLAAEIPDSAQKEALSVLHGMLQEIRRGMPAAPAGSPGEMSLERVANIYELYRVLADISSAGVPASSETSSDPALVGGVA